MTEERKRTDRATGERQERRRRNNATIDGSQRLKLAIPPEIAERLKAEGRVARWVNDTGNRIHQMTKLDDYDRVDGVEPVVAGTTAEGHPIKAYLHSKPAAFKAEDEGERESRRRETEAAMVRGETPNDPASGDPAFYADDANKLSHGGRRSP